MNRIVVRYTREVRVRRVVKRDRDGAWRCLGRRSDELGVESIGLGYHRGLELGCESREAHDLTVLELKWTIVYAIRNQDPGLADRHGHADVGAEPIAWLAALSRQQ